MATDDDAARRGREVREEKHRELARGDVVTAVAAHELGAARDDADRHLAGQWLGLFLAPAVFFAHLQLTYILVPWACEKQTTLWLHVSGIVSVLLAAAGTVIAWLTWVRIGRDAPGEAAGPAPRARLLAVCGFVMSAMFVLLVLAQWVSAFFISPCQ
jgi:hypothetical protein